MQESDEGYRDADQLRRVLDQFVGVVRQLDRAADPPDARARVGRLGDPFCLLDSLAEFPQEGREAEFDYPLVHD